MIVHLEAFGAVLRSTALLAAIKRKYPLSQITWVTKSPAHHLLQGLAEIDRVLTLTHEDLLKLSALAFDVTLVIDKSLAAAGVLNATAGFGQHYGFTVNAQGAIVPANSEANELWELGLSDNQKFFINQKSEQRLVHEALALGRYLGDEYRICLSEAESELSVSRRRHWSPRRLPIVGINTGCSATLPARKLPVEGCRRLITALMGHSSLSALPIVLLGGPEDTARNRAIGRDLPVIQSPTEQGLRDGLASVSACDLVFSGDSLGMHMAIGLKKWVVAWFGPTCHQEIDLYGRGVKILTQSPCSPCWKKSCQSNPMCYDQLDFNQVINALVAGHAWLTSSFKPHSPEMFFSPSP